MDMLETWLKSQFLTETPWHNNMCHLTINQEEFGESLPWKDEVSPWVILLILPSGGIWTLTHRSTETLKVSWSGLTTQMKKWVSRGCPLPKIFNDGRARSQTRSLVPRALLPLFHGLYYNQQQIDRVYFHLSSTELMFSKPTGSLEPEGWRGVVGPLTISTSSVQSERATIKESGHTRPWHWALSCNKNRLRRGSLGKIHSHAK
jgi:hypothetical protein